MDTIDINIFNSLPGCFMIVDCSPEFRILEVTDAYLDATRQSREIIGQPIFYIFPDSPEHDRSGAKNLTASFNRVIAEKKPHFMGVQRYDTQAGSGSPFDVFYWKPVNIPVLNVKGEVQCIIHCVEDVTDVSVLRERLKSRDESTQQQIADAVSTTQELERMEIGRELHDNINQLLITSRLYLGRAMSKKPPDKVLSGAAYDLIKKAIDEIKGISEALLNTTPQEENLVDTLEELISQVMSSGSIRIKKEIELPDESLIESKTKVSILRIVQEQVANVIKHADAKNLFIHVSFKENMLLLKIADDGRGFEVSQMKPGMGFQNMKSRVAVVDGSITIDSSPGDGCTLHVNIPVRR